MMLFTERIKRRRALWWGARQSRPFRDHCRHVFHRVKERYTFRDKNDPQFKWHCCEFWQRSLDYKWNAREFAKKHGCRVPDLYWFGRRVSGLPFDSLPEYYVIKPNLGFNRRGVYVMASGRDLLSETSHTKAELAELLRRSAGPLGRPTLVEEFITNHSDYQLPTEYKCHVFGETIAAILVTHRSANNQDTRRQLYTPEWELFEDPMNTSFSPSGNIDPPSCLNEMLTMGKKLGRAYGTYVRIDFYSSKLGCVFGEFTPFPSRKISPWLDGFLGSLWQESFPDKI